MPGFDQTGPMGNGPMTGGGFGRCGAGVGRGGVGRRGGGRGLGYRRFQQGPPVDTAPAVNPEPMPGSGQLNRLEAALASIEARLARIEGEGS
jgi:hypothetical protein